MADEKYKKLWHLELSENDFINRVYTAISFALIRSIKKLNSGCNIGKDEFGTCDISLAIRNCCSYNSAPFPLSMYPIFHEVFDELVIPKNPKTISCLKGEGTYDLLHEATKSLDRVLQRKRRARRAKVREVILPPNDLQKLENQYGRLAPTTKSSTHELDVIELRDLFNTGGARVFDVIIEDNNEIFRWSDSKRHWRFYHKNLLERSGLKRKKLQAVTTEMRFKLLAVEFSLSC